MTECIGKAWHNIATIRHGMTWCGLYVMTFCPCFMTSILSMLRVLSCKHCDMNVSDSCIFLGHVVMISSTCVCVCPCDSVNWGWEQSIPNGVLCQLCVAGLTAGGEPAQAAAEAAAGPPRPSSTPTAAPTAVPGAMPVETEETEASPPPPRKASPIERTLEETEGKAPTPAAPTVPDPAAAFARPEPIRPPPPPEASEMETDWPATLPKPPAAMPAVPMAAPVPGELPSPPFPPPPPTMSPSASLPTPPPVPAPKVFGPIVTPPPAVDPANYVPGTNILRPPKAPGAMDILRPPPPPKESVAPKGSRSAPYWFWELCGRSMVTIHVATFGSEQSTGSFFVWPGLEQHDMSPLCQPKCQHHVNQN